ncbi:MAG: L,D-transpeptidase family protein [Peptostreptococcus sp.]|uniref:L,D-transpeptidase family protein n=1 Tax=Peptostreptococcus sp. TaxID=1262 RepID=UPI002FCBC310
MSRVARKRLEKEARKNNRRFPFGRKKARSTDFNIDMEDIDNISEGSRSNDENLDVNQTIKNGDRVSDNLNDGNVAMNLPSTKKQKSGILDKNIERMKNETSSGSIFSSGDTMVAVPKKMKTADNIISVEDERMYFERKQRRMKKGLSYDDDVLTVNDIHTAEDDKYNRNFDSQDMDDLNDKPEENINEIKKIDIKEAPFEDVVRVAESRLAAEKENQKKIALEKKKELEKQQILYNQKKVELAEKEGIEVADKDKKTLKGPELSDSNNNSDKANLDKGSNSNNNLNNNEKEEHDRKEKGLREQIKKEQELKLAELKSETEKEKKKSSKEKQEDKKSEEKLEDKNQEEKKTKEEVDQDQETEDQEIEEIYEENESVNDFDQDPENGGKFKKFMKKFLKVAAIALVAVYAIGCVVFNNRFFINTKVNGMDVSFKTPAQLDSMAEERVNGYKIQIDGRNNVKDELQGTDVDMKYVKDGSSKKVKAEQGFFGWPVALFSGEEIDGKLNVEIDEAKLNNAVEDFNVFKKEYVKEPVSAYPRYSEKEKKMIVDKGELGSMPIESKVVKFVDDSVKAQAETTKYPNEVYKPQKNKADDPRIPKAIAEMEKYTGMTVEYDFGYEKYILDGKEISKMFNVDSENDYKVTFSKENVREFVRNLSRKYSTYGDTREIPSASTGGKLKVSGGVYGWLIDRDGETDELVKIIQAGKDVKGREPLYQQKAITKDKNDMGNEFIEIDLSKQHMWFVKDGEPIVSTPIVTGNPNQGDATPPGIYPITYKTRNAVLRGPGYASPVSFWIPFNGNIGIHDASWQPIYGGSRYLYAGSHGCINTPYDKVAQIYEYAKEGMPVAVHY